MKAMFLLCALLLPGMLFAQKVTVKNDVIYRDDQPYGRLVKSSPLTPRFSVRNLDDRELMVAQFDNAQQRYNVSFAESGEVCFMQGTAGFGRILARDVVTCNVIEAGKVWPAGERCFLQSHGGGTGSTPATETAEAESGDRHRIAERDASQPVVIFSDRISQANTTIGTYTVRHGSVAGKAVRTFSFFLPGGGKAAEAVIEGLDGTVCRIVTLKDNRRTTISVRPPDDLSVAKEIAAWLAGRYYL